MCGRTPRRTAGRQAANPPWAGCSLDGSHMASDHTRTGGSWGGRSTCITQGGRALNDVAKKQHRAGKARGQLGYGFGMAYTGSGGVNLVCSSLGIHIGRLLNSRAWPLGSVYKRTLSRPSCALRDHPLVLPAMTDLLGEKIRHTGRELRRRAPKAVLA